MSRNLVRLQLSKFEKEVLYLTGSSNASGVTSEVEIENFPREDGMWGCECVRTI